MNVWAEFRIFSQKSEMLSDQTRDRVVVFLICNWHNFVPEFNLRHFKHIFQKHNSSNVEFKTF